MKIIKKKGDDFSLSIKVKMSKAISLGAKDTVAIALITIGVNEINKQDYIVGGFLVVVGWVLLVVDKYVGA
jgi:hypothetical protein